VCVCIYIYIYIYRKTILNWVFRKQHMKECHVAQCVMVFFCDIHQSKSFVVFTNSVSATCSRNSTFSSLKILFLFSAGSEVKV